MNRTHPGKGRLSAIGLYGMVRELGRKIGLKVWPHGLRHAAITEALDLTGGNVRAVQRFSRHQPHTGAPNRNMVGLASRVRIYATHSDADYSR